jgi:hypothetical protein
MYDPLALDRQRVEQDRLRHIADRPSSRRPTRKFARRRHGDGTEARHA